MTNRIVKCGKCGTSDTCGCSILIQNPEDKTRAIMVDVCPGCNASKDLKKTLTERLYPEQVDAPVSSAKAYGPGYEETKKQWYLDHPGETPPSNW